MTSLEPSPLPDVYAIDPRGLRFRDLSTEHHYATHHFEQWRRPARLAAVLGAALLALGAVVDPFAVASRPDALPTVRSLRVALVLLCLAIAGLTRTRHHRAASAPLSAGTHVLIAIFISVLVVLEGTSRYVGGGVAAILVVLLSAHVLTRMPLRVAFAASVGSLLCFAVACVRFTTLPPDLVIVYALELVTGWASAVAAGCLVEWRARREWAQSRLLAAERERSERLLLNILPTTIAQRLKSGENAIVDRFDDCTVLFADLVGFTTLTRSVAASDLLAMLNRVFSAFDRLALAHGLEKIKTIGDGYLAVAGVPTPRSDHAAAAASMALAMRREVQSIASETGWPLRLRVGLDTGGPALAGVIGTSKFTFDLWGEVVNTAARMESHGLPDAIQVTDAVRQRLDRRFQFAERGEIDVKGIGPMRTHFLLDALRDEPDDARSAVSAVASPSAVL